ncbi:hypothetical protein K503DRAFT_799065 [Rhizopogon vinicolor AM-OR11-026]|uniref:Uncharacterized protein n=1 Tax=Rhizopogon vinicolor AM-OR11-026 TaxID=1314800 RepID=A0A1B7N5I1_9AGAM|nr:hypothetical protein K503DRAFT_799065 [Rhizopogon vinicolor AM-OR11-026]
MSLLPSLLALTSPPLMKASSKTTKQDWDPSSLANYAAIQNPQDDFDSTTCEVKSTPGTASDSYDLGLTSRRYALAGVACSSILGGCCIVAGTIIIATRGGSDAKSGTKLDRHIMHRVHRARTRYLVTLRVSFGVSTPLQYQSAPVDRSSGMEKPKWFNGIMAVLLILSYVSASFAILFSVAIITDIDDMDIVSILYYGSITGLPLLLLGVTLLLQAVIPL